MKKFLAIAALAIAFTACNDEKKTSETTVTDTTAKAVTPDTSATKAPDTAVAKTTTTTTVDTVAGKMKADTTKKK